jgi:hypothetical protein
MSEHVDGSVAEIEENALAREIEERSLNAWPALRRIFLDGWIVGLSEGYTRRANSVNPIYDGIRDLADKIPLCEEAYASHGLPTVFKVSPIAVDMGLDDLLEVRGYEKQATTRVQILTLNAASDLPEDDVEVLEDIDPEWLADHSGSHRSASALCLYCRKRTTRRIGYRRDRVRLGRDLRNCDGSGEATPRLRPSPYTSADGFRSAGRSQDGIPSGRS